jgi:hypothetical protein
MEMTELTNFQKQFLLGRGAGETLFTQKEFDEAVAQAKGEIMAIAIQTTKQAIAIEREECAKLADDCLNIETLGNDIRNRMKPKDD